MRRSLVNAMAILALLLCGASIALWVRSYRTADVLRVGRLAAWSELGGIYLGHHDEGAGEGFRHRHFSAGNLGVWEHEWGYKVNRWPPVRMIHGPTGYTAIVLAWWVVPVVFLGLAGAFALERNWRIKKGRP